VTDAGWVKPVPFFDNVTRPYWQAAREHRLTYQECPACGHRQFYPRAMCTACAGDPEWRDASGRGTVHTFTVIRQYGGAGFKDELPYVVAMIDLEEGVRMMGNITDVDPEAVRIGDAVEVRFVDVDDRIAVPMWRPASG